MQMSFYSVFSFITLRFSIMKLISAGGETPSFKYCKFGGVFGQPMAEKEQQSATW